MKKKKQPKNVRYRTRESYRGRTAESRERQLANLVSGRGKRKSKLVSKDTTWDAKKLEQANIIEFTEDCLGISLKKRPAQEVILRALYGLPMTDEQIELYQYITSPENEYEAGTILDEGCWVLGRRSGKSLLCAIVALYEATRKKWKKYLLPNQIGYVILIATREKQSIDIIQTFCRQILENSKIAYLIDDSYASSLTLKTGIRIESFPCNSTSPRGYACVCFVLDECGHYSTSGPKADIDIFNSIRPAMAQFAKVHPKTLLISSPAAKQGLLYDQFNEGFEVGGRLTVQASTRVINPEIPQEFIDSEYKRDPDNSSREYGAEFSETVSGFFASCEQALRDCFTLCPAGTETEMPYNAENKYFAAIDQSGLTGRDRWCFTISHNDRRQNKIILDVHRTWATKNLDNIMGEIALLCQEYRIGEVQIDRYAKGFVEELFRQKGLTTVIRDLLPSIYTQFKTLVISGKLCLPDFKPLKDGLSQTRAFYGKNNNLAISHERTQQGHGDLADASVTSIVAASKSNVFYEAITPARQRELDEQERRNSEYDILRYGLD